MLRNRNSVFRQFAQFSWRHIEACNENLPACGLISRVHGLPLFRSKDKLKTIMIGSVLLEGVGVSPGTVGTLYVHRMFRLFSYISG
jgi:hypothetical protein